MVARPRASSVEMATRIVIKVVNSDGVVEIQKALPIEPEVIRTSVG